MRAVGARVDRRTFVVGAAALVAGAACGRGVAARQPAVEVPEPVEVDLYRGGEPRYVEEARAWVTPLPAVAVARAKALLPDDVQKSIDAGFLALADACPFDKLQLVFCKSAGWFECPGCGSRYDGLGAAKGGPTSAGMTMLPVSLDDGEVVVHPRPRVTGVGSGTFLVVHRPTGPHCA